MRPMTAPRSIITDGFARLQMPADAQGSKPSTLRTGAADTCQPPSGGHWMLARSQMSARMRRRAAPTRKGQIVTAPDAQASRNRTHRTCRPVASSRRKNATTARPRAVRRACRRRGPKRRVRPGSWTRARHRRSSTRPRSASPWAATSSDHRRPAVRRPSATTSSSPASASRTSRCRRGSFNRQSVKAAGGVFTAVRLRCCQLHRWQYPHRPPGGKWPTRRGVDSDARACEVCGW